MGVSDTPEYSHLTTSLLNRFYRRVRHPAAETVVDEQPTGSSFEHLRGHKYCLLVTYRRTGEAIPTPVWFGLGDAKLYTRPESAAAKVRRIGNDQRVRVAPCTARGRP